MKLCRYIFDAQSYSTHLSVHLDTVKIKDVIAKMNPKFPSVYVQRSETVFSTIEYLKKSGAGAVLVMEGDSFIGIFTEKDLLSSYQPGVDLTTTMIGQEMSPCVLTGALEMSLFEGMRLLHNNDINHLPILGSIDSTRVLHILTPSDIVSFMLRASTNIPELQKIDFKRKKKEHSP
jgi:signal-transduction protein with cAMP-binding, CBS, and nucleotidyltransferase domain